MVSTSALRILKGDLLHKLTARAIIRDWKDGALATSESEQEAKKRLVALTAFAFIACIVPCTETHVDTCCTPSSETRQNIIDLSIQHSIVTELTSFVAVEKREVD